MGLYEVSSWKKHVVVYIIVIIVILIIYSALPETADDLHEVGLAGANAIRAYSGSRYSVGSSTSLLGEAAGASDDYAFQAGFPISFTMELPRGGIYGFDPPASSVDRLVKETWVGIRAMGKRVIEKYPLAKSGNL